MRRIWVLGVMLIALIVAPLVFALVVSPQRDGCAMPPEGAAVRLLDSQYRHDWGSEWGVVLQQQDGRFVIYSVGGDQVVVDDCAAWDVIPARPVTPESIPGDGG